MTSVYQCYECKKWFLKCKMIWTQVGSTKFDYGWELKHNKCCIRCYNIMNENILCVSSDQTMLTDFSNKSNKETV